MNRQSLKPLFAVMFLVIALVFAISWVYKSSSRSEENGTTSGKIARNFCLDEEGQKHSTGWVRRNPSNGVIEKCSEDGKWKPAQD